MLKYSCICLTKAIKLFFYYYIMPNTPNNNDEDLLIISSDDDFDTSGIDTKKVEGDTIWDSETTLIDFDDEPAADVVLELEDQPKDDDNSWTDMFSDFSLGDDTPAETPNTDLETTSQNTDSWDDIFSLWEDDNKAEENDFSLETEATHKEEGATDDFSFGLEDAPKDVNSLDEELDDAPQADLESEVENVEDLEVNSILEASIAKFVKARDIKSQLIAENDSEIEDLALQIQQLEKQKLSLEDENSKQQHEIKVIDVNIWKLESMMIWAEASNDDEYEPKSKGKKNKRAA